MLKVYEYCLDAVLIIDTQRKTMFMEYAWNIKKDNSEAEARESSRRITKATINKHINKYGEFVIGIPILNEFAPEPVRQHDIKKGYIGSFADWASLQKFFVMLNELTWPYFEKYSTCNDWSFLIDAYVKVKKGLSDWDKDFYARHIANENSGFHESAVQEKELIDLLQDSAPLLESYQANNEEDADV